MRDSEIKALEVELFVEALRQRHEYDFSQYARASLRRRVQVLADEEKVEHIELYSLYIKEKTDEIIYIRLEYYFYREKKKQ